MSLEIIYGTLWIIIITKKGIAPRSIDSIIFFLQIFNCIAVLQLYLIMNSEKLEVERKYLKNCIDCSIWYIIILKKYCNYQDLSILFLQRFNNIAVLQLHLIVLWVVGV